MIPNRPSATFSLIAIFVTSACFAFWQNNPLAGVFMLCLLGCIYLGVFRGQS